MIVLGIDPGIARTGWCALEISAAAGASTVKSRGYGVIETPSSAPLARRLAGLAASIEFLMTEHKPSAVAVEELFFMKKSPSVLSVAQARGAILAAAAKHCAEIHEYNPRSVKKSLTGYGSAEKHQMQSMIKTVLGLKSAPSPDDAADAAAIALCHYFSRGRYR